MHVVRTQSQQKRQGRIAWEYGHAGRAEPKSLISPKNLCQRTGFSFFNLISELYFVAGSQFTLNASTTIFNSLPAASKVGRVRDYSISGQFDIPLPEIANVGKPTLSFSGMYLHLLEEPLGEQVKVNGVAVSRTGGIDFFQSKLTVPVKGSGVKIPISFTVANRTELIKEKEVRGTIGVTFDLDSLFSKP
jgi:hypothetical protein